MTRQTPRYPAFALIVASLALFATPSPAAAQALPEPRTWSVTPFLNTSMGIGDPAEEESAGLGAAVAYDLTSHLGFEAEIGHLFDIAGDNANVDWSVSNFSANALYHFDLPRVTPYATFGLGFEHSGYGIKNPDPLALYADLSATEITVNFGGGVKYPIDDRWVVRADLRRFQANDIAPDFWRLYGGLTWRVR